MLSGAAGLPPGLLRVAGDFVSMFIPPLRRLMRIVDFIHLEMRAICQERKLALKDATTVGEQGNLIGVLRAFSLVHVACAVRSSSPTLS